VVFTGLPGETGAPGRRGDVGNPGQIGAAGPAGFTGPQGFTGGPGATGKCVCTDSSSSLQFVRRSYSSGDMPHTVSVLSMIASKTVFISITFCS